MSRCTCSAAGHITAFFIGENIGRFTETIGVQAQGPFFYLPVLLSDTLPWSLCLHVVMTWWADRREGPTASVRIRTLLLLWVAIIVVFFSLSQTKQDLHLSDRDAVAALGADWAACALGARDVKRIAGTLTVSGVVMTLLGAAAVLYLFSGDRTVYIDGARAQR